MQQTIRMSAWERFLLFLPIPGALAFGLGPVLATNTLPRALGFAGDDTFVLRLAGGGTFGFAVALSIAVVRGHWLEIRSVAAGTVVFSALAIPVCLLEFGVGPVRPVVYLFIVDSLIQVAALGWLLVRYARVNGGAPDVSLAGIVFTSGATLIAVVVGLVALLVPQFAANVFGYSGTDVIVYRLGGAETIAYASMGVLMIRSANWSEMRLPVVMVVVFNVLGLIAALVALAQGGPILLPAIVLAVTVVVGTGGTVTLLRGPTRALPRLAARPAGANSE
jgi:hypothetical protein